MTFQTHGRIIFTAPKEKPLPTVPQLAKNAAVAVRRNVAALVSGRQVIAESEEESKRHAICRACDLYRESDDRCAHKDCGCKLKYKTWLKAERCPAGKW